MVLCIFMLSYQSNHGLPMTWVAVLIAMVFEWFVMALALADRFNQMRLENARRQATEIENLQASERRLEEKVAQRTQELRAEQMRTKELLNNMLPDEIAQELADTGASKPVRHESVSVLFADLVGFTQAAATMPPDRMVAELNTLFAGFDRITDECGIDKIKTIGDAYMAAAGVLKPCSDHALRCVRAALRMLDFLEAHNSKSPYKWGLRLGVHTGPVVSGVVGTKRFALDIWGDTVNIAARMERGGETGRVNVSAYTYDLIQKEFDCEYRGKIEAKGKGTVDMYFVIAPS
jgi:class 3 adenylate cyclase